MKKVLLGLTILLSFFISGCDFMEDQVDHAPVLELIGDIDVTIGLNEEYEDPGVRLLGDLDLEITTTSNLDITTYGVYYTHFSVEFDEETITVGRKIRVVPQTEIDLDLKLSVVSTDPFALTFSIEIDDENSKLKDGKAILYLLDEKVGEQSFSDGTNLLVFEELSSFTYYRIELVGKYTDNDVEYDLLSYSIGAKTTMVSTEDNPRLELVGDEELTLNVGDSYVEQGVTVIGDYELEVNTYSTVDMNEPGTYYVVYTVVFNETTYYAHRTVIVEGESLINFEITAEILEVTYDSIKVSITLTDEDNRITIPKGFLYLGTDIIEEFSYTPGTTVYEFENLLHSTTYNFVVKGVYILNHSFVSIEEIELEATTLEVSDITVFMELNGKSIIEMEVNDVFTDPGAFLTGVPDAIITTESNLDTTDSGTYTITYSTTFSGNDYSISRTVIVKEPVPVDFGVSLTLDSTTETSIAYSVTVNNQYSLLTTHAARLFKGTVFIEEISFVEGTNIIEFNNLLPGTEYNVVLTGEYMQGGFLVSMGDYQLTATTASASLPLFTLTSYEIGYEYIDVVINVTDEHAQLTSMEAIIYYGDYQEMTYSLVVGENTISFDYLGHSTDYILTIEYSYVPYGQSISIENEVHSELDLLSFSTNVPPKPTLISVDCVPTDTTVTCTFDMDSTGFNTDIIYFAQLWFNGSYSRVGHFTNGGTTLFFDNLDPETSYTLKVFSNYTVTSTSQLFASYLFSVDVDTLEVVSKTEPVVENVVYTYTSNSITVDFDVVDTDGSFESGYIKLLKGWSSVESIDYVVGHNTITFDTNVNDNETYNIEIRMAYDIGEGWVHTHVVMNTGTIDTPPLITLNTFNEKQMYFSLDRVILQIDLANTNEYDIEFVTIDGTRYETYKYPSNPSLIYIDMGVKTSGSYFYTLDNVGVLVNGEEYLYPFDDELTMQVYVAGTIDPSDALVTVLDITSNTASGDLFMTVTGENNQEDADIDVYIHLDNKYDLTVTALRLYGRDEVVTDFVILSPTLIKATINITEGTNTLGMAYIEYTRNGDTITDTLEVKYFGVVYGYIASEVINIYDLDDLQSMGETGYYRLMNDIDMGGVDWTSLGNYDEPFNGYFNGNGFTISNFNITKHIGVDLPYTYVGFFGYANAFIGDLTLSDVAITVTTDDETNYVHAGILSGYQNGGSVINVHVTGNSSISVDGIYRGIIGGLIGNYNSGWNTVIKDTSASVTITVDAFPLDEQEYSLTVGGLIGSNYSGNILHSHSSGSITITDTLWQNVYSGGLVGYIYGYSDMNDRGAYIINSYSSVDLNSSGGRTGGLLGASHSVDSKTILINTFATGEVFGSWGYTGGLVGYNNGEIHNSFSTGDVNATNGFVGAIYASNTYSYNSNLNMHNVYNWDSQTITKEFVAVNGHDVFIVQILDASNTEFNSEEFYTEIVGLHPYFFDFSNLDILTDHLPTF